MPGTVSTRRAACHQCDACWRGDRRACENREYVGDHHRRTLGDGSEQCTVVSLNHVLFRVEMAQLFANISAQKGFDSNPRSTKLRRRVAPSCVLEKRYGRGLKRLIFFRSSTLIKASMLQSIKDVPMGTGMRLLMSGPSPLLPHSSLSSPDPPSHRGRTSVGLPLSQEFIMRERRRWMARG